MRTARPMACRPTRVALAGVLVAGLAGCGLFSGEEAGPGLSPTPSAVVDATATPGTPEPAPDESSPATTEPVEPAPEPEPTGTAGADVPATLALTSTGVADVSFGTADPMPRLTTLLGPPDEERGADYYGACGSGDNTGAVWGDLAVELAGGSLWGWHVSGPSVPQDVVLPEGIAVGDPLSAVQEATGSTPTYLEPYGAWITSTDGVNWWTDTDQPDSPVTMVVGGNLATCG